MKTGGYVLGLLGALALSAACWGEEGKKRDDSASEKLGIKLSLQCYTYRAISFFETVDKAAGMGYQSDWVRNQLKTDAKDYGIPPNAIITVSQTDNHLQARVQFTRPIPLYVYTYQYNFDHTVKSNNLFIGK